MARHFSSRSISSRKAGLHLVRRKNVLLDVAVRAVAFDLAYHQDLRVEVAISYALSNVHAVVGFDFRALMTWNRASSCCKSAVIFFYGPSSTQ